MDQELGAADRADVDQHLGECAECRRRLSDLAAVDDLARAVPGEAPAGYFDGFASRVRGRLSGEPRPARSRTAPWAWAAAAALLVAALTPRLLQRAPQPESAGVRPAEPPPKSQSEPLTAPQERERAGEKPARATEARGGAGRRDAAGAEAPTDRQAEEDRVARDLFVAPERPPASVPAATPAPRTPEAFATASRAREADALEKAETASGGASIQRGVAGEPRRKAGAADRSSVPMAAAQAPAAPAFEIDRYRELMLRTPRSADEARALRESWRVFSISDPTSDRADEARVRVIETGLLVYRMSKDARDLEQLRRDAAAYLERSDARQVWRVRAVLDSVER
jgi:hypothetical protein